MFLVLLLGILSMRNASGAAKHSKRVDNAREALSAVLVTVHADRRGQGLEKMVELEPTYYFASLIVILFSHGV